MLFRSNVEEDKLSLIAHAESGNEIAEMIYLYDIDGSFVGNQIGDIINNKSGDYYMMNYFSRKDRLATLSCIAFDESIYIGLLNCYTKTSTGLNDISTSKETLIQIDGYTVFATTNAEWKIFSLDGQCIFSTTAQSVSIGSFPCGVYIVVANIDGKQEVLKIVR